MTAKQFELEVLYNNKYVIAEFDKDNYYLDDENSAKSLECRLNELFDENKQLIEKLKKYEEIEKLKKEDFMNCHNCKHDRSVHDGVALDGMCAIKGLMNIGGYFDTEYHRLPSGTLCPCWELEE